MICSNDDAFDDHCRMHSFHKFTWFSQKIFYNAFDHLNSKYLGDSFVGWILLLSESYSAVIPTVLDWGPASDGDFRSVFNRPCTPSDVARWKPVDVDDDIIQLWRRSRVDLDRPRAWRSEKTTESSTLSRRSRAASSWSSSAETPRSESPREPLPPPRSDVELDSSWASSLVLAAARRNISSSSFCSFLANLLSSFSVRWRDLSRSRDLLRLSAAGVDESLRPEAAGGGGAATVAADSLRDLLRLCRTRSQSCTVRLKDSDSVLWTSESSTVLPDCLPAVFDAERWTPLSPLSSIAMKQTLIIKLILTTFFNAFRLKCAETDARSVGYSHLSCLAFL